MTNPGGVRRSLTTPAYARIGRPPPGRADFLEDAPKVALIGPTLPLPGLAHPARP